jgi:large subunit ribosomal protein L6
MSRIGKLPIKIPAGINVEFGEGTVLISKANQKEEISIPNQISGSVEDGSLCLTLNTVTKEASALYGLTRTLIANCVTGLSEGFTRTLDIKGVGYRAQMEGQNLVLAVGKSHPVKFVPPEGVSFSVEANTTIHIKGSKKDVIGQLAAQIRGARPPEPYKGKGIQYRGEYVRRKVGKSGK